MEFDELMAEIKKLRQSGKAVIVEGIKDKRALEKFGIKRVFTLSRKPIYAVIEEVSDKHKEVVILTDLDKEGKQLFGRLNTGLQHLGVKVDKKFREFLFKKTKLRQIEGLTRYARKLEVSGVD